MHGGKLPGVPGVPGGGLLDEDFFATLFSGLVNGAEHLLDHQAVFSSDDGGGTFEKVVGEVTELGGEEAVGTFEATAAHGIKEVGLDGDHVAVLVGVDFAFTVAATALGSHELVVHFVLGLDVSREGCFDVKHCTGFHADVTDGKVFNGVGFVVPVGPTADDVDLVLLVTDVGAGHADSCDGLGGTHGIVTHFQSVHTDVDHRAATLEVLLAEDAPVGNTTATQGLDACELDVTKDTFVVHPTHVLALAGEAVLETDGQFLLGSFGRSDHLLAFKGTHGHGLFNQDMTAGLGGSNRHGHVLTVGGTDADDVRLEFLEHLLAVFEAGFLGHTEFFSTVMGFGKDQVAEADDFGFFDVLQRIEMSVGDHTATDDGVTQFFRVLLS